MDSIKMEPNGTLQRFSWRVSEYTKKKPYQWESLQENFPKSSVKLVLKFGVSLAAKNLTKFTNQFTICVDLTMMDH